MSFRLEKIDTTTSSEETLRRLHDFYVIRDRYELPDDPPLPFSQRLVRWRSYAQEVRRIPRWVLWDEDRVIASSLLALENSEENREQCWSVAFVLEGFRKQGHGSAVIAPALDAAQADGRTKVMTGVKVGDDTESFVRRAGLEPVFLDRQSRLVIGEIDWALVDHWIRRASERATEYELLLWVGPVPEEHLEDFCEHQHIMNSAPREDLEEEDFVMTPDRWRAEERSFEGQEITNYTYIARHKPTGEFAGYTNVFFQRLHPVQALQIDTGVDPNHRNKGLGRWLKATMLKTLIVRHPEIERIDTDNAGSNEPMLNINVALGFKPVLDVRVWQGSIADAKELLGI